MPRDLTYVDTIDDEWMMLIGRICVLKLAIYEKDSDPFPMTCPGLPATEESIVGLETSLGYKLDGQLKGLLTKGNGWPQFSGSFSLLKLEELGTGSAWTRAGQLLMTYYQYGEHSEYARGSSDPTFPSMGELFPIAISDTESDVFAIIRTGPLTDGGHPVIWLAAGQEIDRFPNIKEMLRFFIGSFEDELQQLSKGGGEPNVRLY